jgi:hypothetical protein
MLHSGHTSAKAFRDSGNGQKQQASTCAATILQPVRSWTPAPMPGE